MKVLVLGVTGETGHGLLEALDRSSLDVQVLAACHQHPSAALILRGGGFVSPDPLSSEYGDWLLSLCEREGVAAVCAGQRELLEVLYHQRERLRETGTVALIGNRCSVADDKLQTSHWLKRQKLPFAWTAAVADQKGVEVLVSQVGFPLVHQPTAGGPGFQLIKEPAELALLSDGIVQEFLGDESQEQEATLYVDRRLRPRGHVTHFAQRRYGVSFRQIFHPIPDVINSATEIVGRLGLSGPCNLQFRLRGDQLVCIEIRSRFTSEVGILASLGFNLVDAALQDMVLQQRVSRLPRVSEFVSNRYWAHT